MRAMVHCKRMPAEQRRVMRNRKRRRSRRVATTKNCAACGETEGLGCLCDMSFSSPETLRDDVQYLIERGELPQNTLERSKR
jgi:hypothetical protein